MKSTYLQFKLTKHFRSAYVLLKMLKNIKNKSKKNFYFISFTFAFTKILTIHKYVSKCFLLIKTPK